MRWARAVWWKEILKIRILKTIILFSRFKRLGALLSRVRQIVIFIWWMTSALSTNWSGMKTTDSSQSRASRPWRRFSVATSSPAISTITSSPTSTLFSRKRWCTFKISKKLHFQMVYSTPRSWSTMMTEPNQGRNSREDRWSSRVQLDTAFSSRSPSSSPSFGCTPCLIPRRRRSSMIFRTTSTCPPTLKMGISWFAHGVGSWCLMHKGLSVMRWASTTKVWKCTRTMKNSGRPSSQSENQPEMLKDQ